MPLIREAAGLWGAVRACVIPGGAGICIETASIPMERGGMRGK